MNTSQNRKDLLLVIDMQNVYLPDQPWACPRMPQAMDNIHSILEASQRLALTAANDGAVGTTGMQVQFSRFLAPEHPVGTWQNYNRANQRINEDTWMNALIDEYQVDEAAGTVTVAGLSSDITYPLYSKSTYSALTVPAIREAALHCDRLVLTGVVADCCVLWTAMEAIDLGIPVVYITDAVAGIDDESEDAADRVIRGLSPAQTTLMTTQEYLEQLV